MKNETPNLTKSQRRRLFRLARLLRRVNPRKFNMKEFVLRKDGPSEWADHLEHTPKECGFAGCAIGWAQTDAKISRGRVGHQLARGLGVPFSDDAFFDASISSTAGDKLFGCRRKVGPRRVASDIVRYLKTGALPRK